ncbi:MAG: peptide chain release factor N(5)-glutamine methyltransferase [Ruminococcaceae bacterium]|nr:peptide chain release factor N(5)-glutamine methyltransferase [Oscillospiraceae bacterium]
MTYQTLFLKIEDQLKKAGCDSPSFDAVCLLEDIGKLPPQGLPPCDTREVEDARAAAVLSAAEKRAAGYPLQYILGDWAFLRLTLKVGEGVLIPRPDTELLCEVAAARLDAMEERPRVLDLCAGSGCVGLGVASLCRTAPAVTAVELSDAALPYLKSNIARYPQYAVEAVQADVLRDAARFDGAYAAILSNPPYIPTADLTGLMREVQHEPTIALDGAADGLLFYRAIANEWVPKLQSSGFCAVEVGIGQAADVSALFTAAGLCDVTVYDDLGGVPRVVVGTKE